MGEPAGTADARDDDEPLPRDSQLGEHLLDEPILGIFRDYRTRGGAVYYDLDRYQRRSVLPLVYFQNIADYVRNGGALLVAAGPVGAEEGKGGLTVESKIAGLALVLIGAVMVQKG